MDSFLVVNTIENSCGKKPLILIVENDEDNLFLLTYFLGEILKYKLLTSTNSQDALSLTQQLSPDLILLDIVLPDVDGLQVVRKLKLDETTKKIPVIAVTALALDQEKEKIFAAGCDDYICKPYSLDELETVITTHWNKISA